MVEVQIAKKNEQFIQNDVRLGMRWDGSKGQKPKEENHYRDERREGFNVSVSFPENIYVLNLCVTYVDNIYTRKYVYCHDMAQ